MMADPPSSSSGHTIGPKCPKCGLGRNTRVVGFDRNNKKIKVYCETCNYGFERDADY